MRKAVYTGLVFTVLCLVALFSGAYPSSPLEGRLRDVTVTKRSIPPALPGPSAPAFDEKTIRIQDPQKVAAIEASLKTVWTGFGANSMEGFPKYDMRVEYTDGRTQSFFFTRAEWEGAGRTPAALLKELEKNGL